MAKIKNEGQAGITYHKMQRGAAIAAGTAGYFAHLPREEQERRVSVYQALMDLEEQKMIRMEVKS